MAHPRNVLSRAYQRALGRLRANHDEEFHEILAGVYAEMGLDIRKRASRAEMQKRRLAEAQKIVEESTPSE